MDALSATDVDVHPAKRRRCAYCWKWLPLAPAACNTVYCSEAHRRAAEHRTSQVEGGREGELLTLAS